MKHAFHLGQGGSALVPWVRPGIPRGYIYGEARRNTVTRKTNWTGAIRCVFMERPSRTTPAKPIEVCDIPTSG